MTVADAVAKRATVRLALATATTPGKYLLLFSGPVAEVEESFKAGQEQAGPLLIDKLLLPVAARSLVNGLQGAFAQEWEESLGIVETHSVAAALLGCDTALKRADVRLVRLHLARGIGGKGYFVLTGALNQVQAALDAVGSRLEPNLLLTTELIQRPDPSLRGVL